MLSNLKNKLVAVLGYGQEGKATARYLIKHGVTPVLFDQKPWEQWKQGEKDEIKALGVNFIFGPDCFKELTGFDIAFRSPGIRLDQVTSDKLQVTSQTKWFFEHCPSKIIGITGTKGKGTTATLISEILKLQFKISSLKFKIHLTGNIGEAQPFDFLDDLTPNDWIIYELSSFQLQDLDKSPHIAVVLMITSEHLDYHKNLDEYVEAKTAITKFQGPNDFAIYNIDYPASIKIGEIGKGTKIQISREQKLEQGCFVDGDKIILKNIVGTNFQLPTSDVLLKGSHNLENICAAVAAAAHAGASKDVIQKAINTFKGLSHRLELVTEKQGIKFYDDSISTTPETAVAAINSFFEPLILILGGSSKNSDFSELGNTIKKTKNIKAIILIGEEADSIKTSLDGFKGQILENAKNMQEIFRQIKQVASSGDVVLLSPACASFDMFKDYKDRGEQFKNLAKDF